MGCKINGLWITHLFTSSFADSEIQEMPIDQTRNGNRGVYEGCCQCMGFAQTMHKGKMMDQGWICFECGYKYGQARGGIHSFHGGVCDWCKDKKAVTGSRHYGYPKLPETPNEN